MFKKVFVFLVVTCCISVTRAQYSETMNVSGVVKNLKKDYDLKNDNAKNDQSDKLKKAISDVNAKGGGVVKIPKGIYSFSSIYLKSNVHILIEKGTIIKPKTGLVFALTPDTKDTKAFIKNVSVRGDGGAFVIDYHTKRYKDKQRAIVAKMVKNFLIQDMIVKDNYSTFCGITLAPSNEKKKDVKNWEVSRPTLGTIKNITHYKASPGYGLVQCHGAKSVHFENLYSLGGVSLRLEVGANNKNVGVYDLTAKNIINENGRCAVMMGPHSAKNGIVKIDGIKSISSTFALKVGDGGVKKDAPDQTPGYFHKDTFVDNIVAVYGTTAQVKGASLVDYPGVSSYNKYLREFSDNKFFDGPSIAAVEYSPTNYTIKIGNVKRENFPKEYVNNIITKKEKRKISWGEEKKKWEKSHLDSKWKCDKGVAVNDYYVKAYKF